MLTNAYDFDQNGHLVDFNPFSKVVSFPQTLEQKNLYKKSATKFSSPLEQKCIKGGNVIKTRLLPSNVNFSLNKKQASSPETGPFRTEKSGMVHFYTQSPDLQC